MRLSCVILLALFVSVTGAEPEPTAPAPITVWLVDGSTLAGVDLIRANDRLLLKLSDGTVVLLPDPLVQRIGLSLSGIPAPPIPEEDPPKPDARGFTVRAPQQLAGSQEPIDFVTTEEALAAIPRRGLDFPTPPIDPAWAPTSGWWQGSIFDPADRVSTWANGVLDPSWQSTHSVGLHSEPVGFRPSHWQASIIDPFWYPTDAFKAPLVESR
ncbi:MAG: hypothetical protein OES25_07940 [Acidobacteriota bacterium]|nr:hypothetical protein [Acidobacteriota bacterium]